MIILWHHCDLRLVANPALEYACSRKKPLLPLYIHNPKEQGKWVIGKGSSWWLHQSLTALAKEYAERGSGLAFRVGDPHAVLHSLAAEKGVEEVCWVLRSTPALRMRDEEVAHKLEKEGIAVTLLPGNYLVDPQKLLNQSGQPYRVFAPFYNTLCRHLDLPPKKRAPSLPPLPRVRLGRVEELNLLSSDSPEEEWSACWQPGRKGALLALQKFCKNHLPNYPSLRDYPAASATSYLSPHLHFGELAIEEVWRAVAGKKGAPSFQRELGWREFSHYILHHFPKSAESSWKEEFRSFSWKKSQKALTAWQEGRTGYPFVDAGMRQLLLTGWMHNRVRMVVASFLVKDLMIDWREGARWFWEWLVDADLANNTMGWQWVAGSGADAAPYFRIFNPITQSKKYDPKGEYLLTYLPELRDLPERYLHTPWEAPEEVCAEAGIVMGEDYPFPIVDHEEARERALNAYQRVRMAHA